MKLEFLTLLLYTKARYTLTLPVFTGRVSFWTPVFTGCCGKTCYPWRY